MTWWRVTAQGGKGTHPKATQKERGRAGVWTSAAYSQTHYFRWAPGGQQVEQDYGTLMSVTCWDVRFPWMELRCGFGKEMQWLARHLGCFLSYNWIKETTLGLPEPGCPPPLSHSVCPSGPSQDSEHRHWLHSPAQWVPNVVGRFRDFKPNNI